MKEWFMYQIAWPLCKLLNGGVSVEACEMFVEIANVVVFPITDEVLDRLKQIEDAKK